ncbi:hypothetical protein [Rhodococcoides kroppenstedtii]|nr:hypothetical protein [Rhodococcus kroppenstedtii]
MSSESWPFTTVPPEEAAEDILAREAIRATGERHGHTLDDTHVTAVQWEVLGIDDGFYARWRFAHPELDMDVVHAVAAAVRG